MNENHEMKTRSTADAARYASMDSEALRASFLVDTLFRTGAVDLTLTDLDRAVVGSAVPLEQGLRLPAPSGLRADFFCDRRELGILNIGGEGRVTADGTQHTLGPRDGLYVGRGTREVTFESADSRRPAEFYLLSYPAHASRPTAPAAHADAKVVELGSDREANRRTIRQYIHEDGVPSCQLVMGYTELAPGNVWNTMPPHTHDRRTEIYTYFDLPTDQRVLHLMGRVEETRHLWVADRCAVLSPSWSIHSGVGTADYCFIWGMGGENQAFADMDGAGAVVLR